jgi:hypothetical protein
VIEMGQQPQIVDDDRIMEFIGRKRAFHFNVAPRYTPGSPAWVPEGIARKVAIEERESYEHAREGVMGLDMETTAKTKGLLGIVELHVEEPRRKAWRVLDLITGETFERPYADGRQ